MRITCLSLILLFVGCVQQSVDVIPPKVPIKTHPAPIHKIKRMVCGEKPAVIAVIDTGLSFSAYTSSSKLCKFGHKNFTKNQDYSTQYTVDPIPSDNHGHGTNVAGLIQANAPNSYFCMVIIKYYDPNSSGEDNLKNTINAIQYAININVKYINYSGGGTELALQEQKVVKEFLDKGGRFIAAAGNERSNIDTHPYYPAMDDPRVVSVGSIEKDGSIAKYSNWGTKITRWETGTNQEGFGLRMSGTSQAAAIAAGKIIKESECEK